MSLRAFVSGASGFVGRTLIRHLSARSIPVVAVSRSPMAAADGVSVQQVVDYRYDTVLDLLRCRDVLFCFFPDLW